MCKRLISKNSPGKTSPKLQNMPKGPGSMSEALMKTYEVETESIDQEYDVSNSVELSAEQLSYIEGMEMCPIHPDKPVEGYNRLNGRLT